MIAVMSAAFAKACTALGLVDRTDPITEVVARHIIELVQKGVKPHELYRETMLQFKPE